MKKKQQQRIAGFTMLEILIAMFILATVTAIIFGAYASTFRIIGAAETQADLYQMGRMTMERLREDLEGALLSQTPDTFAAFLAKDETMDGRDADTLSLISAEHLSLDDSDTYAGLSYISFYLAENSDKDSDATGFVLYRADTPLHETLPEENTGGLVLCESIHTINLTYYDAEGDEYDRWDSSDDFFPNTLPARVSIRLQLIDSSDPETPLQFETAVALPMAAPVYGKKE